MKQHIGIFVGDAIEKILSGRKTIESRFSLAKILPYGSVFKDDIILLKKTGGDIVGQVIVDNVLYYDDLTPTLVSSLKDKYQDQISADENYWARKSKSRFGTLIFLKSPKRYVLPLKFKKHDRRPWLIYSD